MSDKINGPWVLSQDKYGVRQIHDCKGESIMGDETYYPWCPEEIERWRLIAAAPELLEALQELMSEDLPESLDRRLDTCDKARAAIAKATGSAS